MNAAVIGLGSNIHAKENIQKAKEALARENKILTESRFITTKPVGILDQADFLNGAVLISTSMTAQELKSRLKKIEKGLGKENGRKQFGPRTIDLDILVWNSKVVNPDFFEREFIRRSVLELLPDLEY